MALCSVGRTSGRGRVVHLLAGLTVAAWAGTAGAATLAPETIFDFSAKLGANSESPLVPDAAGRLYATTADGASGNGTVIRLSRPKAPKTTWSPTVLHVFAGKLDGTDPLGPVLIDGGSIYGTTFLGGSGKNGCYADGLGCGTVYRLTPKKGGGFTYSILHRFLAKQSANDGAMPISGLTMDAVKSIYGTTTQGGGTGCTAPGTGCGVFFRISSTGAYSIVYRFGGGSDANTPVGTLTEGKGGVLYGVSQFGGDTGSTCVWGSLGCGTVFSLTPNKTATKWTESVIYRFTGGADGSNPYCSLAIDSKGALYGTTSFGGANRNGVVFRLKPPGGGNPVWSESVLHDFTGGSDGAAPNSGVIIASPGHLLGLTASGGNTACAANSGCGVLYELTAPKNNAVPWAESIQYSFAGKQDGGESSANLLAYKKQLFGTTLVGGSSTDGTGTGAGTAFVLHTVK